MAAGGWLVVDGWWRWWRAVAECQSCECVCEGCACARVQRTGWKNVIIKIARNGVRPKRLTCGAMLIAKVESFLIKTHVDRGDGDGVF